MARANEKMSRPQPFSTDIGVRNWPTAERGPKLSNAIKHPHKTTTAGVRHTAGRIDISLVVIACRSHLARCTRAGYRMLFPTHVLSSRVNRPKRLLVIGTICQTHCFPRDAWQPRCLGS